MSTILTEQFNPHKIIGLWHITETLDELITCIDLNKSEAHILEKKRTTNKKKEWLASRILIKELTSNKCTVAYDKFGKPFDTNQKYYVSISHSKEYCAVIVDQKSSVGIDVQKMKIPFKTGHDYFINHEEMCWIDPNDYTLINLIWSAKETIYKMAGIFELNFKEAITILPFKISHPFVLTCQLHTGNKTKKIKIEYKIFEEYILTYTI